MDYFFVDIPKTAGSSIRAALDHKKRPHYWASKAIEEMGRQTWDELFTFTFVRNPFDRIVSQYHFQAQKEPHVLYKHLFDPPPEDLPSVDFQTWVRMVYEDIVPNLPDPFWAYRPQTDWFMDGNKCLVKYIGRFERLWYHFKFICAMLDRPSDLKLPHHKQSQHRPWWEYYDAATAKIVTDYFARDFELLGYSNEVDENAQVVGPIGVGV